MVTFGTVRTAPAAFIGVTALTAVAAAWWLQWRGYAPCELCLKERFPYYVGVVLSGALALGGSRRPAGRRRQAALRFGYALLTLVWIASAALGAYHTGVEWKLWAGPAECSGTAAAPAAVGDFLKQLESVTVVRCDEAALQVFGLSLAAWNALLSIGLAGLSVRGNLGRPKRQARAGS
jgi:disulfide bond formation protein DsbB